MTEKQYFLKEDSEQCIDKLCEYHDKWVSYGASGSPVRQSWVRNYLGYYSPIFNTNGFNTSMVYDGAQGELVRMYTPKVRSLVRQLVSLIGKQRLSFQAQVYSGASTSDVFKAVKLGNAIFDQVITEENLNNKGHELLEQAIVMGAAFMSVRWRTDRGEHHAVRNGQIIYKGGVDVTMLSVLDVFYDVTIPFDTMDWIECRVPRNRWDLIAQHPNLKQDILALPSWYECRGITFDYYQRSDDYVAVFECYAKPTPSVPKGRMIMYSDQRTVYYDGDNKYKCIPIIPLIPEPILGTSLGYPKLSDILPAQEMFDNSISAVATNQSSFAVQSVTIPRGSDVNVNQIAGMNFISFTPQPGVPGGGKPESLNLTNTPQEVFKFIEILDNYMSELSGIQPILRGQTSGVTSGAMVATLTANAMEFLDASSRSYHLCMETMMGVVLKCYQIFGTAERSINISGRQNNISNKSYNNQDLQGLTGVKILTSNPILQSTAGRLEVAEKLLSLPKAIWPDYISILDGKPLEEITKSYVSQDDLIFQENESLNEGESVVTLATDNHRLHIQKHSQLLNSPEIRMRSDKIQGILQHISEHMRLEKETDPELLAIIRGDEIPMSPTGQDSLKPFEQTGEQQSSELGAEQANPAEDLLGR